MYAQVEQPYDASLFTDGLLEEGPAWTKYTQWLNATIPRDFHGLNPFDQRACLVHRTFNLSVREP